MTLDHSLSQETPRLTVSKLFQEQHTQTECTNRATFSLNHLGQLKKSLQGGLTHHSQFPTQAENWRLSPLVKSSCCLAPQEATDRALIHNLEPLGVQQFSTFPDMYSPSPPCPTRVRDEVPGQPHHLKTLMKVSNSSITPHTLKILAALEVWAMSEALEALSTKQGIAETTLASVPLLTAFQRAINCRCSQRRETCQKHTGKRCYSKHLWIDSTLVRKSLRFKLN